MKFRQFLRIPGTIPLIIGAAIALYFIFGQIRLAGDTDLFYPGMRTLYPHFRLNDPALFPNDYAADYYSSIVMPLGYKALYYGWSLFADVALLHRFLPIVLWLISAPLVFYCALRIGGRGVAWSALAIYLCSSIFVARLVGGLAHSFAFPLMWWSVAALLAGRPVALACAVVASAAFYPVMTPVIGLTLAFWLLFPRLTPACGKKAALSWPLWWKFALLATAALTALVLLTPILGIHQQQTYGRAIETFRENEEFPESGPRGVYNNPLIIKPLNYFLYSYYSEHAVRFGEIAATVITLLLIVLLVAGIFLRDARDKRLQLLKPFFLAFAICFLCAIFLSYTTAYRFIIYPGAVMILLYMCVCLRNVARRQRFIRKGTALAALTLTYIALIAEADPRGSGYEGRLEPHQKDALRFIQTLPKDVVLAGWPLRGKTAGVTENIPYYSRRKILLGYQTHAAIHTNYVLTMRERMDAIIDAFFAQDIAPLIMLRDRFDVDYLVVDTDDLTGEKPPSYVAPFKARIQEIWDNRGQRPFVVLTLDDAVCVYCRGTLRILDLHKLTANP